MLDPLQSFALRVEVVLLGSAQNCRFCVRRGVLGNPTLLFWYFGAAGIAQGHRARRLSNLEVASLLRNIVTTKSISAALGDLESPTRFKVCKFNRSQFVAKLQMLPFAKPRSLVGSSSHAVVRGRSVVIRLGKVCYCFSRSKFLSTGCIKL